jgi:ArsR family transcriptional regulator, zinc-responsive transcriptional repressor
LKPDLMDIARLAEAAECLKVMAHPMRLRMVDILMQGEFTVGEIARLCGLPHHQACGHLRLLEGHRLLASGRRGRSVYYKIANPRLPAVMDCIRKTCRSKDRKYTTGARDA